MNTSSSLCQIKKAQRRERGDKQTQRAQMWEGRWSQLPKCVMAEVEPWSWQHWYDCTQRWTKSWHSLMMTFLASVKCMQRRDDWQHSETPQKGGVSFTETRVWKKADSLWLSRKKGERESSSGSREEREGAKVCSAPVRRGVKEGRTEEWEEREKVCGRLVRSWRKGEEIVTKREILITRRRRRKLTNSGRVTGAERGIRGQGGGTLRPGEWCSRRRAGVGCLGWAERPYLSEVDQKGWCYRISERWSTLCFTCKDNNSQSHWFLWVFQWGVWVWMRVVAAAPGLQLSAGLWVGLVLALNGESHESFTG